MKPVPKDNKGLGKLPKSVRNKMGYMSSGGVAKNYSTPVRKPDVLDEVIKEERPDTKIKAAKSPKPEGRSRMKLRDWKPDPEKVMYYI